MSGSVRFEKIPLVYERAFGGWDRDHPDPRKHSCEPRNPVGTGYRGAGGFVEGLRLPNLEDPRARIKSLGDRPPPAGFGFISPHWQPRAAFAGTYDEAWQKEPRAAACPRTSIAGTSTPPRPAWLPPGYLRGDEPGLAVGVTPEGRMPFTLPGVPPPVVQVTLADGPTARPSPWRSTPSSSSPTSAASCCSGGATCAAHRTARRAEIVADA